jgi:hypothetical protein
VCVCVCVVPRTPPKCRPTGVQSKYNGRGSTEAMRGLGVGEGLPAERQSGVECSRQKEQVLGTPGRVGISDGYRGRGDSRCGDRQTQWEDRSQDHCK